MKTEKRLYVTLRPERAQLTGTCIKFAESGFCRHKLPYREIVWAAISVCDRESGVCYEPEITDITGEMKGDLVFFDKSHCRWRVRTDLWDKPAGAVLIELATKAPYIMIGAQPWFEAEEEEEFAEIADMVEIMRHS